MNQDEQWFTILRRKRLRHALFPDLRVLAAAITASVDRWKPTAHPYNWTGAFFEEVIANVESCPPCPFRPPGGRPLGYPF